MSRDISKILRFKSIQLARITVEKSFQTWPSEIRLYIKCKFNVEEVLPALQVVKLPVPLPIEKSIQF